MDSIFTPQDAILLDEAGDIQIIPISPTALLIVFGDAIHIAISQKVTALYLLLKQKNIVWIKELTPAYASLGITYDLYFIKTNFKIEGLVFDWVKSAVLDFMVEITEISPTSPDIVEIPVCFNAELSNDLAIMSKALDLTAEEIIEIFLGKTYDVYMLGFLPGFSYMGEVDGRISIARKADPTPTQAGAVGIAGNQTGIYPLDSLGGWHILGFTPVNMFNPTNNPPNFLQAGNKVRFLQIDEKEYVTFKSKTIN